MIEIVSRWNKSKVLYRAENAVDVRAAVIEASKERAYLQGAYLQGAYLQGADLRRADLRRADLQGADLQGADLQGADLQGAYLQGAYLQGAYLQGAYLQGADLQGADLRGADLHGAWPDVAMALKDALAKISLTGHWIKGAMSRTLQDGALAFCASGAVENCTSGTTLTLARWLLAQVAGGSIEAFNDHEDTTLEQVQQVFGVAIMHAERWS